MTCTTLENSPFVIRSLGAADVEQSFRLATRVFVEGSTLHRALSIGLDEYRDYLWPSFCSMADEELSVVAVDTDSNQILACLIVTKFRPDTPSPRGIKGKFAPLTALTSELVERYLSERTLTQGDAVLVDMGAVAPEASGMGVYKAMRQCVNQVARDRGFRFILGELSSAATQRVVINRMGHRKMAEVKFSSFEFGGACPFASISHPNKIILSEGDLALAV